MKKIILFCALSTGLCVAQSDVDQNAFSGGSHAALVALVQNAQSVVATTSWTTMTNLDAQCIADYQTATNYMRLAQQSGTQGQQVTNLWQAVSSLCNSLVHMHDAVVKIAVVVRQDVSNRTGQ